MRYSLLLAASVIAFVGNGCISIDKIPTPAPSAPETASITAPEPETGRVMAPGTGSSTVQEPYTEPSTTPEEVLQANATTTILLKDFAFSPPQLVVKKGPKITFRNTDSVTHAITANNGAFKSGLMEKNQTFYLETATMVPGTYTYHCDIHPTMKGTLMITD